jgi:tetratricopeptide (TPR) repeat protein
MHSQQAGANPFVKQGKPAIEMGPPMKVPKVSNGSKGSSHPEAKVRPASNLLPTLETTDRPLSAALLRLAISPTAASHRAVADRYVVLGVPDMAYEHYLRASQLDRTDALAYEGLARVWRDWGFPQLGLADASRAVFYAPQSASAHNTYGMMLAVLGHGDEARHEYTRAVQLDANAAYAWNNLCALSFHDGDRALAREQCGRALSIDPALTAARDTLASIVRRDSREQTP